MWWRGPVALGPRLSSFLYAPWPRLRFLRKRFESEYRAALARAADTLDLEPVLTLVQRTWWVRAVMYLNPEMLDGVASDVNRVAAGDESVFADEGC
ncbi:MAG: DUF6247 family protein [Pseudonocardiaceae bacterium]